MLIFGALFRCIDPILTIAAALSCQSPFASFWGEANEARAKHKAFADDKSDFLTLCNVWKSYCKAVSDGQARKFISANFLSRSALAEIRDMREHFVDLLCDIGFLQRNQLRRNRNWYDEIIGNAVDQNSQSFSVVHAVICAGLFGNVAHLIGSPSHGRSLTHNGEMLHFHSSSVNSKLATTHGPSMWITFFEKFETNRVFISTTSPIHPFSMLLFGGHIEVRHLQRLVVVDDWIELGMAAQTGVMFRELRRQVSELLEDMIANKHYRKHHRDDGDPSQVIDGIVKLLTSSPGNY
jgi:ATP-dependent RNA helicase DHX29